MGFGDEIMATGIAKRLHKETGKKVAFGRNNSLVKSQWSDLIFKNNPKIASHADLPDVVWNNFCVGSRGYIKSNTSSNMLWNEDFKAEKGEFFFTPEDDLGLAFPDNFVVIEPHTKQTVSADNKQWPVERMQEVVDTRAAPFIQFDYGKPILNNVIPIKTRNIREAAFIVSKAKAMVTMEGGMHHISAALNIPAVVIFSGYISPGITGYEGHINLYKAAYSCGSLKSCPHCKEALGNITTEEVILALHRLL